MPPGSDTPDMISAVQEVARCCRPALLADIGCGMGVLGIAALLASPDSRGVLIDLDMAACEAAIANLVRLGLSTRATVVRGDGIACLAPGSLGLLVRWLRRVVDGSCRRKPNKAWQTKKDLDLSPGVNSGGWFHTCDLGLKKPKVGGS
jgi:hypothetical protein